MSGEQTKRLWQRLKPVLIVLLLGTVYYIWLLLTGLRIPCLFKTVTGFDCPGCGVTRMIMAVLRLDFKMAFNYNGTLMIILPVIGMVYLYEAIRYIKNGETKSTALSRAVTALCCIALLIYGIVRNI